MRAFRRHDLAGLLMLLTMTPLAMPARAECERSEHIYQSVIDANPFIAALWEANPTKAENAILEFKTMSSAPSPDPKPSAEEARLLERNPLLLKAFQENPGKTLPLIRQFEKELP